MKTRLQQIALQASVTLLLVASLACCNGRPAFPELNRAENLMEEKPDSALNILEKIPDSVQMSKQDQAMYYMLLTLAQDKNYITHTSDSIIKIAANYFEKQNDTPRAMLAYYCMGRVYTDMREAILAQECYLKALELGADSKDYSLLIKIHNNLGTLYAYQDINERALPMYKKVLQYLKLKPDSANTSFALRNIARIFSQIQQTDSAILYYKQALIYSTPLIKSSILLDMGNLFFDKKDYIEAEKYIDETLASTNNEKILLPTYLSKGCVFIERNLLDSAKLYLTQSLQSSNIYTKATSFRSLAQVALKENKLKDYVVYTEQHELLHDSITAYSHFENIRMTESMFNYQRITKEKNKFEKEAAERLILNYQVIIFSTLILLIGIIVYKRERDKKKRLLDLKEQQYKRSQQYIQNNLNQIALLEKMLSSKTIELSEAEIILYETQKAMLQMENRTIEKQQGIIQVMEEDLFKSSLYLKIHAEEDIQLNVYEWVELRLLIDSTYSDFTNRLVKLYNKISTEEIHVCYLVKINVPVKKIASIIHISGSGVSQCRRRLYKKFTNEKESTEKFDNFIAGF